MKDTLCIIPYYDYVGAERLRDNHGEAIKSLQEQGVDTLTIEAVYNDEPRLDEHETVRLAIEHPLWCKETLINYGVRNFRDQYKYIAWVDSGILLPDTWLEQARYKLQTHDFLQCFSKGTWQDRSGDGVERVAPGYAACRCNDIKCHQTQGGAWVGRAEKCVGDHFLYDKNIVGGGDSLFASAVLQEPPIYYGQGQPHYEDYLYWHTVIQCQDNSASYVEGNFVHLWHTTQKKRQQVIRYLILVNADYDPVHDTTYDDNGLLTFSDTASLGLRHNVKSFLVNRATPPPQQMPSRELFKEATQPVFVRPPKNTNQGEITYTMGGRVCGR